MAPAGLVHACFPGSLVRCAAGFPGPAERGSFHLTQGAPRGSGSGEAAQRRLSLSLRRLFFVSAMGREGLRRPRAFPREELHGLARSAKAAATPQRPSGAPARGSESESESACWEAWSLSCSESSSLCAWGPLRRSLCCLSPRAGAHACRPTLTKARGGGRTSLASASSLLACISSDRPQNSGSSETAAV